MLIVALVLAVIGLAALVTAVVTGNEVVAWVCIAASALGVVLLVVDAIRERQQRRVAAAAGTVTTTGDFDDEDETTEFVTYDDAALTADAALAEDAALSEQQAEIEAEDAGSVDQAADGADVQETVAEVAVEDHPEEVVHDEPEYDTYGDDEPEYPEPAEESAVHVIDESDPENREYDGR